MKRWAIFVVLLYFLTLIALTSPLILVVFYPAAKAGDSLAPFAFLQYWAGLGVVLLAQAVMLLAPVDLVLQRPTSRRSILWPILASGLMMGVLGAGVVFSIDEFVRKDRAGDSALPGVILLVVWAAWSVAFYRTGRDSAPADVVARQCRYLLRGSILELLVAVPTHIVARVRDYCCAGIWTFLGIAFGLSVILFSFGPGVFFLFAARWKRLHPQIGRATD